MHFFFYNLHFVNVLHIGRLWKSMATFTNECVFSGSAVPYDSFKLRDKQSRVPFACL